MERFWSELIRLDLLPAARKAAVWAAIALALPACTQITPVAQKKKKIVPKVGQLIPNAGTTSGGTTLSIIGAGFVDGSRVTLGSQDCLNITIISATEIRCITPSGMPEGLLEVVIIHPTGGIYRVPTGFRTFDTLPAVAGRVIASQGGVMMGTDGSGTPQMQLHLTVGEPVASGLQNGIISGQPGAVLKARMGVQGVLYDQ